MFAFVSLSHFCFSPLLHYDYFIEAIYSFYYVISIMLSTVAAYMTY
jgi:hypothetical protein